MNGVEVVLTDMDRAAREDHSTGFQTVHFNASGYVLEVTM
jgi:hypothetical protein